MKQTYLENAEKLLIELKQHLPKEAEPKYFELKTTLRQAWLEGEGEDANELRSKIKEMEEENSTFISVMVHEVRKPMTSIRGYVDMLVKNVVGELNEMQSQFANTIRNNVISMEALVTDISDISKMRSGRITASPKMDTLKNLIMELEKDLVPEAEARNVSLTFEIPSGLPMLNLDGVRLVQALRKLIDNSIKYTIEGEGVITVSAEGTVDRIAIKVTDNGVGISEADQSRLGELFFRGDNDRVIETKGYGMGIPIALECMKLVEGELSWESAPETGSKFTISVPAIS